MKAAIFGANGYLGRHLVHYLGVVKGYSLTCFDVHDTFSGKENISYVRMDVTDREQVAACGDFDQIFFFSGRSGTSASFTDYAEFIRVNEIGLLNLLDHYKDASHSPRFIFPSTRLVYKGVAGKPLAEDAEKECKTIYASSKSAGERYLQMYRNLYGLRYTVFRLCVPYAQTVEGPPSHGTVGFFLANAAARRPIVLFGDGKLRRSFTHVTDVCRQLAEVAALPQSEGECFNIDGETFSLLEVAERLAEAFGVPLSFVEWPPADLRIESGDTIFDAAKIRSLFPQTLTRSLAQWIDSQRPPFSTRH